MSATSQTAEDHGSLADASRGLGERDGNLPKFTPGPWTARDASGEFAHHILGADDTTVCLTTRGILGRKEAAVANAALIAAAPKLLLQCELLERSLIYEIRKSLAAGDEEGANLKTYTLFTTMEVLAEAKGLPAPTPDAALALARGVSQ